MKKAKKVIALFLVVVSIVSSTVVPASAASLDDVTRIFAGWGVSISVSNDVKLGSRGLGGLDNTKSSVAANYKFTQDFTYSITFGGSLSSELSGSINATSGATSGGLGAKVNSSSSVSANFTYKYTQDYSTTVPAKKNLTLYSDSYGKKITGYAKYFACWITTSSGSLTVKIPQYQKFRAVIA